MDEPVSGAQERAEDFDRLYGHLIAFAVNTIAEQGAFQPFAAVMSTDGRLGGALVRSDQGELTAAQAVADLRSGLSQAAAQGEIRASGICFLGAGSDTATICVEYESPALGAFLYECGFILVARGHPPQLKAVVRTPLRARVFAPS